jgi:dehydrogenase/reductase SDR family protein 12
VIAGARVPDPRVAVDGLLELSVAGSFSRLGPDVRRRLFGWSRPAPDALAGRTVLVTGPTSGLGRAATHDLAALGARVVLVGRSETRLAAVRDELVARSGQDRFPIVVADMASLESVRDAAARIAATEERLDVVVDNAGAVFPNRTTSVDGLEATLATLVIGPFRLAVGLLPLLERTPGARVIAVTTGGMYAQSLPLDDLQYRQGAYSGLRAYARAKRAQVALTREWARRLRGRVAFVAMHPGWVDTPGLAEAMPAFHRLMGPLLRTVESGADTIGWLATQPSPAAVSGGLYLDRRRRPFDRVPGTRLSAADRRELWDAVVHLAGVEDPAPDG